MALDLYKGLSSASFSSDSDRSACPDWVLPLLREVEGAGVVDLTDMPTIFFDLSSSSTSSSPCASWMSLWPFGSTLGSPCAPSFWPYSWPCEGSHEYPEDDYCDGDTSTGCCTVFFLGGLDGGLGSALRFLTHLTILPAVTLSNSRTSCSSTASLTCCTLFSTVLFPCIEAYYPAGTSIEGGTWAALEVDSCDFLPFGWSDFNLIAASACLCCFLACSYDFARIFFNSASLDTFLYGSSSKSCLCS